MPVNIDVFVAWPYKKRQEYLVEYARSLFLTNTEEVGKQGWLNLYDTQTDLQRAGGAISTKNLLSKT